MTGDGHYRVDLGQLASHIEACGAFDAKVEEWIGQIDAALARLRASWSGQAAQQQRAYNASYSGLVAHQRGMWP